jgi:hypothetical protein
MMWARSVIRSSSALQSRGFGNTVVHSENGKFVVTTGTPHETESYIRLQGIDVMFSLI